MHFAKNGQLCKTRYPIANQKETDKLFHVTRPVYVHKPVTKQGFSFARVSTKRVPLNWSVLSWFGTCQNTGFLKNGRFFLGFPLPSPPFKDTEPQKMGWLVAWFLGCLVACLVALHPGRSVPPKPGVGATWPAPGTRSWCSAPRAACGWAATRRGDHFSSGQATPPILTHTHGVFLKMEPLLLLLLLFLKGTPQDARCNAWSTFKSMLIRSLGAGADEVLFVSRDYWGPASFHGFAVNELHKKTHWEHMRRNNYCGWTKSISHHLETMGHHSLLVFTGDSSFQGV